MSSAKKNILEIHQEKKTLAGAYFLESACDPFAYIQNLFPGYRYEVVALCPPADIKALRRMKEKIFLSSRADRPQVVLIPADTLRWDGKTALLKLLEEPPPHTHIILYGSSQKILPLTIRSRVIAVALEKDAISPIATKEAKAFYSASFSGRRQILALLETREDSYTFLAALEGLLRKNGRYSLEKLHYAYTILSHPAPTLQLFKDYIITLS